MLRIARTASTLRKLATVALSGIALSAPLTTLCIETNAQGPSRPRTAPWEIEPTEETKKRVEELIEEIVDPQITIQVDPRKSRLVRTKRPVSRFSITNPSVIDIVQFSPTEFELIGNSVGITTMTLWYPGDGDEPEIIRYLVRVAPDETAALEYGQLQDRVNELFPCSRIQLIPVADKLIVRGQAKDAAEVSQILAIIGGEQVNQAGQTIGRGSNLNLGTVARPYLDESDIPAANLISLLQVPGEQQIMLRVRIAELSRSAQRAMGSDISVARGDFTFNSLFGGTSNGPVTGVLSTDEFNLAMSVLNTNSFSKMLAEPNLVTINGRPASFNVGGAFAVPTVVGVGGVGAVSTDFQSFGTNITFTPFLIEKDRLRLQVSPSVTEPDGTNTVNGIPGISGTSIFTTVDLREGQWMAIGGLLQDDLEGAKNRMPFIGDIPILGTFFSERGTKRTETEIVIFVSPELVHPLEAEEVPLILPGMEITEPTDWDFFFWGRHQGRQGYHYRSTVWLEQQDRIVQAHQEAMKEARRMSKYQNCEACYIYGDHGFSY
jgi:pilus assembly protein CpaC